MTMHWFHQWHRRANGSRTWLILSTHANACGGLATCGLCGCCVELRWGCYAVTMEAAR